MGLHTFPLDFAVQSFFNVFHIATVNVEKKKLLYPHFIFLFSFIFLFIQFFKKNLKSLILTCVPKHEPPSHLPLHISLSHPHAPAPSKLHPMSDMDWRFSSYMTVYMLEFPFSQIVPPSPSPSESKSPLYTSVSFFLSCIQGRHGHLPSSYFFVFYFRNHCLSLNYQDFPLSIHVELLQFSSYVYLQI